MIRAFPQPDSWHLFFAIPECKIGGASVLDRQVFLVPPPNSPYGISENFLLPDFFGDFVPRISCPSFATGPFSSLRTAPRVFRRFRSSDHLSGLGRQEENVAGRQGPGRFFLLL